MEGAKPHKWEERKEGKSHVGGGDLEAGSCLQQCLSRSLGGPQLIAAEFCGQKWVWYPAGKGLMAPGSRL